MRLIVRFISFSVICGLIFIMQLQGQHNGQKVLYYGTQSEYKGKG
jgi:hypothetical protein